jgi:uncharacterized coiled-coil DUF342 family protein
MTLQERIAKLEATFQEYSQIHSKANQDAQNAFRSMDQIAGAIRALKELEEEQTIPPVEEA